ncbi:hypothetical protein Tco_1128639, partial [Tanacetum coccineum]
MDFQVGDKVMLKVSPWKGVVHFGKRGKLNPRYVRPFKVLEKVGSVAYKLELPKELSTVHNTFNVSNLKKCHADEPLAVPLEGLHFDDKLQLVKELVEIIDREVKRLKRSRIPLVKLMSSSNTNLSSSNSKIIMKSFNLNHFLSSCGLEALALSHTDVSDSLSVLLDEVIFPQKSKILPVGDHLMQDL